MMMSSTLPTFSLLSLYTSLSRIWFLALQPRATVFISSTATPIVADPATPAPAVPATSANAILASNATPIPFFIAPPFLAHPRFSASAEPPSNAPSELRRPYRGRLTRRKKLYASSDSCQLKVYGWADRPSEKAKFGPILNGPGLLALYAMTAERGPCDHG